MRLNLACFGMGRNHYHYHYQFLALVALCLAANLIACEDDEEPPFPLPIDLSQRQVKILSESVDNQGTYQTVEEYLDTNEAKLAMVVMHKHGHDILFQDGKRGLSYAYKPYTCLTKSIGDLPSDQSEPDLLAWNHKFTLQVSGDELRNLDDHELVRSDTASESEQPIGSDASAASKEVELRAFNVIGLWMFASQREKTYTKAKIVYNAAKDMYQMAFCWTVRAKGAADDSKPLVIKLCFVDEKSGQNGGSEATNLSLVFIEIKSSSDESQVVRSINVLTIEYSIDAEASESLLEVPVGYGCFKLANPNEQSTLENPGGPDEHWEGVIYRRPALFDLEVTATDYKRSLEGGDSSSASLVRSTDTIGVQVAHSYIEAKDIKYMRIKSTEKDVKTLLNYLTNVKYTIDMRRGTCEMSHVPKFLESYPGAEQGLAPLQFSNGLQLDLMANHAQIFHHSEQQDKFRFVKRTAANYKRPELFYYESDGANTKGSTRQRIVRTYSRKKPGGPLELYNVLMWTLDDNLTKLLQTFQINVIDMRYLKNYPDEPKLFDVSEECYLNDEHKRSGKDYAWIELTYPALSRDLDLIAANELQFKRTFYWNFIGGSNKHLDFSRVPRLELRFQDEALVLRMLLLDSPPLELVYDKSFGKTMSPERVLARDKQLAPDLRHCAELCRLNRCTLMAYCDSFSCLLSHEQLNTSSLEQFDHFLELESGCDTYSLPDFQRKYDKLDQNFLHEYSLQGVLARLQHQDYGLVALPGVPDEVASPFSDTGLSFDEYQEAVEQYQKILDQFLVEHTSKLPELTLIITLDGHFMNLMPSKFELENDPLADFDLYDTSAESEATSADSADNLSSLERLPSFHEGLAGYRYKSSSILASSRANEGANLREFAGLTYDQCALACLDSRCGSFSHCRTRQECILSNLNSTSLAQSMELVERDPDCLVAQRDFISNYVRFENSFMPTQFRAQADSKDAAACALECEATADFRCLAFDFCAPSASRVGTCYYHDSRSSASQHLQHRPRNESSGDGSSSNSNTNKTTQTGCAHFIRSALADFNRIEYRKVADEQLDTLKSTTIEGKTVATCAEMCATELLDCTAFQFCFNANRQLEPPAQGNPSHRQQCIMIQSKPDASELAGFEATIASDPERRDQVLKAGKFLVYEPSCQLFALRKDSSEAHLRDLAIKTSVRRTAAGQAGPSGANEPDASGHHTNLFYLYTIITLISAAIGCGLCYAREHNYLAALGL